MDKKLDMPKEILIIEQMVSWAKWKFFLMITKNMSRKLERYFVILLETILNKQVKLKEMKIY